MDAFLFCGWCKLVLILKQSFTTLKYFLATGIHAHCSAILRPTLCTIPAALPQLLLPQTSNRDRSMKHYDVKQYSEPTLMWWSRKCSCKKRNRLRLNCMTCMYTNQSGEENVELQKTLTIKWLWTVPCMHRLVFVIWICWFGSSLDEITQILEFWTCTKIFQIHLNAWQLISH